jgi:DNA-binding NarL/FixJ family response regulator
MAINYIANQLRLKKKSRSDVDELGYALSHCWDLPILQTSSLARLPSVVRLASEETQGLELAKALRKELISCVEQITQRQRYPIDEIVSAIEKHKLGLGSQELMKIKRVIGVPFRRNKLDLARYYTIRLIMQGIDQQTIADFLEVDLRTVANYVAQAKERIRMVLESRSGLKS